MKKLYLEILYQEECLEQRVYEKNEYIPMSNKGEKIHFTFENNSYNEDYGNYWIVKERKFIFHPKELYIHTIQLICEPVNNF